MTFIHLSAKIVSCPGMLSAFKPSHLSRMSHVTIYRKITKLTQFAHLSCQFLNLAHLNAALGYIFPNRKPYTLRPPTRMDQ